MYDDFKLKKPFGIHGLYENNSLRDRVADKSLY